MRFMLEAGLLVPGTYVYYDDYSIESWNWPEPGPGKKGGRAHLEERLAHEEITREFELEWKPLFRHKYRGPVPGLEWITQWPETNKKIMNHYLVANSMTPVLQLVRCGRGCPT